MTLSKEQLQQLELINICPQKFRKEILKRINEEGIKAICECCLNVLHGNIPLTEKQKGSLSKHKRTLRTLAERKVALSKKRKLVLQKGGFLNILIPTALSVLSELFHGAR
ncbi:hypothetical protein AVEN_47492-1 [Araneus ventricosus]|uniref:Uncharacterized protein n=1 Tax=Araneus ventricosus TaxID=182803 RepID=A0A4Y2JA78_ARAVE|nr:hypothetical protein AVEN_47492-1 [Araneus ventricosus]